MLLASGASSRVPGPYKDLLVNSNVFTIRTTEDHNRIKPVLKDSSNIIIVGGSFIGLECATTIRRNFPDKKVTIIDIEDTPLEKVFGTKIAGQLIDLQRINGV